MLLRARGAAEQLSDAIRLGKGSADRRSPASAARRGPRRVLSFLFGAALAGSMVQTAPAAAEAAPGRAEVAALIGAAAPGVRDAAGWAQDILANLAALKIPQTDENICAVVAVVAQESGFVANPAVPRLGAIAEQAVQKQLQESAELRLFFSLFPDLERAFMDRVRASKTERDLDLACRYLMDSIRTRENEKILGFLVRLFGKGSSLAEFFESQNRISTIGSMQVSVRSALIAERQFRGAPLTLDQDYRVRDFLYTRTGGLRAGIRQLLGYETGYSRKIFRFADYNAGRYGSRNAAFQKIVASLSGETLALDGDLLSYDRAGSALTTPSNTERAIRLAISRFGIGISDRQLRADLLLEKQDAFVETATFKTIRALYMRQTGTEPPFAMIPQLRLSGLKITRPLTTEWYANRVNERYQDCMNRSRR
jgi:hypothetical protein